MSEKTRLVPQFPDETFTHTLVIESAHEYKVHGPYGSNFPYTIGGPLVPMVHGKFEPYGSWTL